jgi:hypothetical protein
MSRNPFVGVWRLISCEAIRSNGTIVPIYGRRPSGRLSYDDAGHMNVEIARAGRPQLAYSSQYEIDRAQGRIVHRVLHSLIPGWIGTVQARFYQFLGDGRLLLSTEPIGPCSSRQTTIRLVWEKMD